MPQENNTLCVCGKKDCAIPFGKCHCECGEKTNIARCNSYTRNQIKSLPMLFVKSHTKNGKPAYKLPSGMCVCRNVQCNIPYGYCHCGCGGNVKFNRYGVPNKRIFEHSHITRPVIDTAAPFKIEGVYCRIIPLTKDQFTIVNESDYVWLMQWKWYAKISKKKFYASRGMSIGGKDLTIRMQRVILGLSEDDPRVVDHENLNTLDNRRDNLRIASYSENSQNQSLRLSSVVKYKGVDIHQQTGLFRSRIQKDGKPYHLGLFATAELAYAAYCNAALEIHEAFARLS